MLSTYIAMALTAYLLFLSALSFLISLKKSSGLNDQERGALIFLVAPFIMFLSYGCSRLVGL